MDDHQIFRKLLRYCRGHRLNSVDHLVCHLVRHLALHLVHLHLRTHHRYRLLDEVRQIRLDVRRDLRLVDLVHLDARQLDEVRQLRCCYLDEHLVHRMKMDCFQRAVAAARK